MHTRLAVLLREFAQTEAARACADPAGAYANCLAVSVRCAEWLREQGMACALLRSSGSRVQFSEASGRWPLYDPQEVRHWTVRVGPWSIDWTARQFRPRTGWPEVKSVASLAAEWSMTDVWACHRCLELVAHPRHRELAPSELERAHREVARATGGRGPFADARHDGTPALVTLCACDAAQRRQP
jgi:hypothetical protein